MGWHHPILCKLGWHFWCSADFVCTGEVIGKKIVQHGYTPQACLCCDAKRDLYTTRTVSP